MKINGIFLSGINFCGVAPEYTDKKGYRIIPVEIKPGREDIENAIKTTKESEHVFSGRSGRAYFFGEDLVVKKYLQKDEAANYDPEREIRALDSMYESGIKDSGLQRGLFAFKTPDGEYFLVSKQIHGIHPHKSKHCFNRENLAKLVSTIQKLDEGIIEEGPFGPKIFRIMHNDLSMANIKADKESAGILDFEYMNKRDISDIADTEAKKARLLGSVIMNFSEITMTPTNLKDFEYRTLAQYLRTVDNPGEIFKYYLEAKSVYFEKMADFYKKCGSDERFKENEEGFYDISNRAKNYAALLKNAVLSSDTAVLKAEAIKMQIADFLYLMTPYSSTRKFNPKQVREYIDAALEFFEEEYNRAKSGGDILRAEYYSDCLDLMENQSKARAKIDEKMRMPKKEDFTKEEIENGDFTHKMRSYEKFLSKTTKDRVVTLEKLIA